MSTLTSSITFEDEDRGIGQVRVTSEKCLYRVVVSRDKVKVYGPGVEREYTLAGMRGSKLTLMGKALMAVVFVEEGK